MSRRLAVRMIAAVAVIVWAVVPRALMGQAQSVPQRIISLVPATTEMLFAIGAGARVVGVGTYDRYPPAVDRLPRLGGLLDPNTEELLRLKPDLVVVYETQLDLRQRLERSGIPQWSYSLKGLADVTTTIRQLGIRIGAPREAGALADTIEQRLRATQSRVAGLPKPRTLLVFGREPGSLRGINASGGVGFLHDLVELVGGVDVLADVRQGAVSMSTEMILARRPEVIIELHSTGWTGDRTRSEAAAWNALAGVPAVRAGRVHLLDGDQFVVPGPRVVDAAEALARALHPQLAR